MTMALAFGLSLVAGNNMSNVSYASTTSYRNNVQKYVNEDADFRQSEDFKNANDALVKIYEMNIDYAKVLLNNADTSEAEFDSVTQELRKVTRDIKDQSDPMRDSAKLRVELRLSMVNAKDLLISIPKRDYNKKEYEDLSLAYGQALNVFENVNASDADVILANSKLKRAAETFQRENNRKAMAIRLEAAINANKKISNTAKLLLEKYPQTVKTVKTDLEKMIKESDRLIQLSEVELAKLK